MKILHLIQKPQNRGAETFACQLANNQKGMGHEILMLAVFEGSASLSWEGEIHTLNASAGNRFMDIPAWKKLADYIRDFNPDIIQANAGDTLKYAVLSKLLFRWDVPLVFRNASEVGRYLNSEFQKKFNAFLYKQVTSVISVSRASEKDLIHHFPFLKGRTSVVPVGLEKKTILPVHLRPDGRKHIVHVGGFSFEKNHEGIIRIFKKVLEKKAGVHLHFVGDGPLRPRIEDLVKREGLQNKVTFYGFVNNPLSFIKGADILILPSIIEGLPGVLLEAMYCKIPVVAYNVGGIPEIITERTGSLIPKGDEEKFAQSIIEVLNNPQADQIKKAHRMVVNGFMNDHLTERFLHAYRHL